MKKLSLSLFDQVVVSGGNFLVGIYCAWFMTLGEVGLYGYLFSAYMALLTFNLVGFFQPSAVFAPRLSGDQRKQYQFALLKCHILFAVVLSVIATAFFIFMIQMVESDIPLNLNFYLSVAIYFFLQQLADYSRRSAYIFLTNKRAILISILLHGPRLIFLFAIKPHSFQEFIWVLALTSLLPAILVYSERLSSDEKWTLSKVMKIHFTNNKWLVGTSPLMWAWAYGPMFILGVVASIEAVGLFVLARAMLNIANIAMELLETHASSEFGKAFAVDKRIFHQMIYKVTFYGACIWGAGLVVIILFGESIFRLLYAQNNSEVQVLLAILWLAYGMIFLFRLRSVSLRTVGANKNIFVGYALGCIASCTATFYLSAIYDSTGAAIALCVGALFILLGQIMVRRDYPLRLHKLIKY